MGTRKTNISQKISIDLQELKESLSSEYKVLICENDPPYLLPTSVVLYYALGAGDLHGH